MGFNFRSYLFTTVLIPAVSFSQSITRLDDSKISLVELDQKETSMALPLLFLTTTDRFIKKSLVTKGLIQKNLCKQALISMVHP